MNEKVNYDGVKFGMLTVIKDGNGLYEGAKKRRSVICKCDCGNEKEILLRQIQRGKQKSCGCLATPKIEFKEGDKFGYWTVIRPDSENYVSSGGCKSTTCEVKCICGKVKTINKTTLKNGKTNSCGCQGKPRVEKTKREKVIPTDTEEEQWTTLFSDNDYLISTLGRIYSTITNKYINTKNNFRIKSCIGLCLHKEVYKSFKGDYNKDEYMLIFLDGDCKNKILSNLFLARLTENGSNWVARVKTNLTRNKKDIKNTITFKDIVEQYNKQKGLSYFLKIPMDTTMKDRLLSVSIDRIDNKKGYDKDNFKLVTRFENLGRNDTTFQDMEKFSNEILTYMLH